MFTFKDPKREVFDPLTLDYPEWINTMQRRMVSLRVYWVNRPDIQMQFCYDAIRVLALREAPKGTNTFMELTKIKTQYRYSIDRYITRKVGVNKVTLKVPKSTRLVYTIEKGTSFWLINGDHLPRKELTLSALIRETRRRLANA